jgi:hypothetical protein
MKEQLVFDVQSKMCKTDLFSAILWTFYVVKGRIECAFVLRLLIYTSKLLNEFIKCTVIWAYVCVKIDCKLIYFDKWVHTLRHFIHKLWALKAVWTFDCSSVHYYCQ